MSEMEQEKIVSLNADKTIRRALDIKDAKDLLRREGFCVTDKAQDFYNDKFDEIETLINNTLNVWNKARE